MDKKYARVVNAESGHYNELVKIEEEGHEFGTYARDCATDGSWYWEDELEIIDNAHYDYKENDLYTLGRLLHVIVHMHQNKSNNAAIHDILKIAKKEIIENYDPAHVHFEIMLFELEYTLEVFHDIMDFVRI